jgi:hypothetical protein
MNIDEGNDLLKSHLKRLSKNCKTVEGIKRTSDRVQNTIDKLHRLKKSGEISNRKFTLALYVQQRSQKELYNQRLILLNNAQNAEVKLDKTSYRYKARFNITVQNIETIKGYSLLCSLGFYNKINNPNGVVKDHRFSIKSGMLLNIPAEQLGNINNCEFLSYYDNLKKSSNNSISLEEFNKICPPLGERAAFGNRSDRG